MEKNKVNEKENLKELFEIKKKYEAREEKLIKEILRKENIINKLHKEKNVANKSLKEDENVKENIKKENCMLKKEKKELSNENIKLKSENKEFEIGSKKSESEIRELNEDKKRLQIEIVEYKVLTSSKSDETKNMKQKLEAYNEDMLKENNLLKNKSYRVGNMETSRTEQDLTTAIFSKNIKKRRKFKFFKHLLLFHKTQMCSYICFKSCRKNLYFCELVVFYLKLRLFLDVSVITCYRKNSFVFLPKRTSFMLYMVTF